MLRRASPAFASLLVLAGCVCSGARAADPSPAWREVQPGLAYRQLIAAGSIYHVVRVSLATHELRVADARREGRKVELVEGLGREAGAIAAINGTFFDEKERPLGLLVSQGRELNPLRDVSWWAALAVREGAVPKAEILTTAQLASLAPDDRASLRFALQVGPRTVVENKPLKLKRQLAARSAVCVTKPGEVLLVATESAPVESNDLAALMASPAGAKGLGCEAGLMLDGGPSTQLWVRGGEFELDVRGGWGVPNAIVVVPRAR